MRAADNAGPGPNRILRVGRHNRPPRQAGSPPPAREARWGQASPESTTRLQRSKSCPCPGACRTLRLTRGSIDKPDAIKVRLATAGFGVSATAQTPPGAMLAW